MTTALVASSSSTVGSSVQLDVHVDVGVWENQFDTLEIWRSMLGEGGPYVCLMGETWGPARLPGDVTGAAPAVPVAGPNAVIVGLTLELEVNATNAVEVTFTGGASITYGQAATQIQAQSNGLLTAFVIGSRLVIETTLPGAQATLRVVGGEAAPLLGLAVEEPENTAFGLDARIPLVSGVTDYLFTDPHSFSTYFYKSRFFNTVNRSASSFGPAFRGVALSGLPSENLVLGGIDFVDIRGVGKANQVVIIYARLEGLIVDGKVVAPSGPTRLLSDADGHVEIQLVRGTKISVAIAGTDLVRDIDVPTDLDITSFNLLDPAFGANDLFKVQVPLIDYAVRRSM